MQKQPKIAAGGFVAGLWQGGCLEPHTLSSVEKKRSSPYHEGKRRTETGFTDKALTEQLAAKFETEAELRRRGLIDPAQEELAKNRSTSITDHLAAFEKSLGSKDNTGKHVKLTIERGQDPGGILGDFCANWLRISKKSPRRA